MHNLGPGSYELGSAFDRKGGKFGRTGRMGNHKSDSPGPGAYYSGKYNPDAPSYGFGHS
jgi:hypothetical protein